MSLVLLLANIELKVNGGRYRIVGSQTHQNLNAKQGCVLHTMLVRRFVGILVAEFDNIGGEVVKYSIDIAILIAIGTPDVVAIRRVGCEACIGVIDRAW